MASEETYKTYWEVKKYYLFQSTGGGDQDNRINASIVQGREKSTARLAFVYFTTEMPLPADYFHTILGAMLMHCSYDRFALMIEMLREEKPIWVHPWAKAVTTFQLVPNPSVKQNHKLIM